MFSPLPTSVIRALTVAVATLAALAFAPGRAVAGCGDYDMPAHPRGWDQLLKKHDHTPAMPVCHGPHCSKSPAAPLPSPKAPVHAPTGGDDLAAPMAGADPFTLAARRRPGDQIDESPARLATLIYHPPR